MKLHLPIFFVMGIVGLTSCKTDIKKITIDYIDAINQYDSLRFNKSLDRNFTFSNNPFHFINRINLDSFKSVKGNIHLMSILNKDSVTNTVEQWTSVYDSLLIIKTKLILHNTYRFQKNHIKSVTVNRIENYDQYKEQFNRKFSEFNAYLDYEHIDLTKQDRQNQVVHLLTEFTQLSPSVQKEYRIRNYLKNSIFISNNLFGMGLKFTGKRTVSVSVLGVTVGTTYLIDNEVIQIEPTQGSYPMPLTIKDGNTMIGKSLLGNYVFKRVQ